ncbi:MAG: ATP-dependent 6-phosphofructokinase [bacterium]
MADKFDVRILGVANFDSTAETTLFVEDGERVLVDATTFSCRDCKLNPPSMERAGPRRKVFFAPGSVRAAIVTCGGLCPGLNDVVRAVVMVLWYRYGVRDILGLKYGFEGLVPAIGHKPLVLNPEVVADIHRNGGTILGTSRGGQDPGEMVEFLIRSGINVLFTVGGDGTQHGALVLAREIERRKLSISVIGIPKTIDNDIAFTERSFGFETAVAESQNAIDGAHMEAKGVRNGIGLVKLMGREAGFVAAYATLASSDVNLVLIPEQAFSLDKVMSFLQDRLLRKAHAVIVVAEGAGQDLVASLGVDASGNKTPGDIGIYLKTAISHHFQKAGIPVSVKYIDPAYLIRSVPANADDSVFCFQLAGNAVHAAMSGRTAMVVGLWNGQFVHIPVEIAIATRKNIDVKSLLWQSVLDNTGQPKDLL